jgi:hypothetical protein
MRTTVPHSRAHSPQSCTKRGAAIVIHEFRAAAKNGQFNLTLYGAGKHRHLVFAGLIDHGGCRRSVDAIRDLSIGSRNRESDASGKQPNEIIGLEIDQCVGIEMERAVVGKQNLDAAVLCAQSIAGKERHVCRAESRCPSRSRTAVPSTNETCAGGSAATLGELTVLGACAMAGLEATDVASTRQHLRM